MSLESGIQEEFVSQPETTTRKNKSKNFFSPEERDLKKIFNMFRKRKFKGDSGQAIKNSSYQLATNLIMKFGSLLFIFIIARLLQPERMGLYNLALSTIMLFAVFSDFGISASIVTYLSKALGKSKPGKAKGYAKKLFKWKKRFVGFSTLALIAGAYFISEYYYQKPIFYAVLVGALYLPAQQMVGFLDNMFRAENNFKMPMKKEILIQVLRLVVVPGAIFWFIQSGFSDEILIMLTMLALTSCYLVALLFMGRKAKSLDTIQAKAEDLNAKDNKDLKKFILPLAFTALAGTFFGNIDTLMLGHYVESEFIAYYGAAFALVTSAGAIIGFLAAAMMPIFSREKGGKLESMFKKTKNASLIISVAAMIFTYFAAYWVIKIAYGDAYLTAVPVLKWFSVLLVINTLTGLHRSYFTSQKRTKIISALLIGSTILNIALNFFGISYGVRNYGNIGGVYGAIFATIISRVVYLGGFMLWKGKK